MSILERKLPVTSRSKIYLILACISLILFFYSVSQIAYVVTEPSDLFGLASHLTPSYWIGLVLLLLGSILAFLDKELKSDFVNLFILLSLGLYLFGIATLVQENVRSPTIYTNLADVRNLLATGHTDIAGPNALSYYRTWPAAHFLHATTLLVTGLDFEDWLRFAPFVWVISFTFITYAIGRRLELSRNSCFLLSFLALASYWMLQSDFVQQGMAVLLFLSCFMLLAKPDPPNTVAITVLAMLVFSALVLTHGLTSMGFLLALAVVSIYRKLRHQAIPLLLLFAVLWLTWYTYQAFAALEMGAKAWWAAPWDYILRMGVHVEGLYKPTYTTASALITQYSQIAYIFLYGILALTAVICLLTGRIKPENRPWLMALLVWVAGLALSGFIYPNREMYTRLYILELVPVIGIILTAFSARKLLIPLMLLCLLIFLPARYGTEASWGQVYSTELAGARFSGARIGPVLKLPSERTVKPWLVYKGGDMSPLAFYYPDMIYNLTQYPPPFEAEVFDLLDGASYVFNSSHGGMPDSVISEWMELGRGEEAALIYSNGDFRIYVVNGWN
jgi:hypothetical protein